MTDATPDDPIQSARGSLGTSIARLVALLWQPEMLRWRWVLFAAIAITIVAKVLAVISPLFFGDAINQLAAQAPAAAGMAVFLALGLWGGTRLLSNALPSLRDALFADVSQDAQRLVAVRAFHHAHALSLEFHQTKRTGALDRVIMRGTQAIDYLLRFLTFNIAPTLIELILAAIVMGVAYGAGFSAIAVVTVFAYVVFTVIITEWRVRQRRAMNIADTEARARAVDSLTNFESVKTFAAERREAERYDGALRTYNRLYVQTSRSLSVLNVGQEIIMSAGVLAMAGLAVSRALSGAGGPGDVAAVVLVMMNLYRPLNILGWAWREIKQGAVDLEKLYGLLDMQPDVQDAPDASALKPEGGGLVFEHVHFTHSGRRAGIRDVSFTVEPGQFIGLAGPSGGGKSTLLRLLLRLYDVHSGDIRIDGRSVRSITQESLRQAIGLVPQEVALFNDTLRFNLSYARPDASEDALLKAAEQAQLGELIASLPQGLDTRVGERGLKLSGGEKQRVGLARVLLKDPCILLLDEATASLDTATERDVQAALSAAAKGRTTLAVAHRLSTIAGADQILVLENGSIAEAGTHAGLLSSGGLYAKLWSQQANLPKTSDV